MPVSLEQTCVRGVRGAVSWLRGPRCSAAQGGPGTHHHALPRREGYLQDLRLPRRQPADGVQQDKGAIGVQHGEVHLKAHCQGEVARVGLRPLAGPPPPCPVGHPGCVPTRIRPGPRGRCSGWRPSLCRSDLKRVGGVSACPGLAGTCGPGSLWVGGWARAGLTYSDVAEVAGGLAFVGCHYDGWCHRWTPQLQVQGVVGTGGRQGELVALGPCPPRLVPAHPATVPLPRALGRLVSEEGQ